LKIPRKLQTTFLGIIVSVIVIVFITSQLQLDTFVNSLLTANYAYLIPCIFFLVLGLITRALRWQILLNHALPLNRTFSIMNVAYLVNGVLPLRLGEVVRMYLASRVEGYPVPMLKTAGTIIIERLLDLLAVVMMVLFALMMAPIPDEFRLVSGFGAVSVVVGFLVLIILVRQREFTHRLLNRLPVLKSPKFSQAIDAFLDGLEPLKNTQAFLKALGWTVLSWSLSIIAGYWLMFAIFGHGSLATTMLYIAAAAFAIAVPAVPGNLGTYEGAIWAALTAMGYQDTNQVVAFAVLVHAVNVFVHVSTGIIGFIQEGISLNQLQDGVRNVQQLES
jgi:glycosyltransferase 2 family protein